MDLLQNKKYYFKNCKKKSIFTFTKKKSLFTFTNFYFSQNLLWPRKFYFRPANEICGKYIMRLLPRFSGAQGCHFGRVWNKIVYIMQQRAKVADFSRKWVCYPSEKVFPEGAFTARAKRLNAIFRHW